MNILVNRAHDNLNILYNLNSGDTLNAKRGEIIISDKDDFVQVDNISDLEYSIYFTYHQLLTSNEIVIFLLLITVLLLLLITNVNPAAIVPEILEAISVDKEAAS